MKNPLTILDSMLLSIHRKINKCDIMPTCGDILASFANRMWWHNFQRTLRVWGVCFEGIKKARSLFECMGVSRVTVYVMELARGCVFLNWKLASSAQSQTEESVKAGLAIRYVCRIFHIIPWNDEVSTNEIWSHPHPPPFQNSLWARIPRSKCMYSV